MRPYLILLVGLLTSIYINCFSQTESKKELRLRKKHETWDSCFIVKANGDTIYGKVDHRSNQSSQTPNYSPGSQSFNSNTTYMSDMLIFFAHPNQKEEQFIPNDLKELYVFNAPEGYKRYLTLEDKWLVTSFGMLSRIVVDGECKLTGTNSIYYKGEFFTTTPNFKKSCSKIFAPCPWLVKDIADGNYTPQQLQEIVVQFNRCIAK